MKEKINPRKYFKQSVIRFQKHNFVYSDGVIGKNTCALINQSLETLDQKVKENIQRIKDSKVKNDSRLILVNIPTYQIMAIEKGKVVQSQKVVVGTSQTKTPIMLTYLKSVSFNPTWTVPTSLFFRFKLDIVKDDPDYLARYNYVIRNQDGEEMDAHTIDWPTVTKLYFPYTIKQMPGKNNALGLVKFNLDNKFMIYLHDTPTKEAFSHSARALSSGCVRLSKPIEMAAWVLKGTKVGSKKAVKSSIDSEESTTITLKNPIPVHFVYITTWIDENGELYISNDPYKYDGKKKNPQNS